MPAFSFDRGRRLLSAEAYRRVFENPVRQSSRHFTLLARTNDAEYARLGLAVPKKHVNKAIDRNRIKRLIRESFRLHQQSICGLDLVILARSGIAEAENRRLLDELDQLWSKAAAIPR